MKKDTWKNLSTSRKVLLIVARIIVLSLTCFILFCIVTWIRFLDGPLFKLVTDLDCVEQYSAYQCYDEKLVSLHTLEKPIGYYALPDNDGFGEEDNYDFYICYPIDGHSKDEFLDIAFSNGAIMEKRYNCDVFQNPGNLIHVRKDWTIKEIQILGALPNDHADIINDETVLQKFYAFYNNADAPMTELKKEHYQDKAYHRVVRVIFNESQSIVWVADMKVMVYHDGTMAFTIDIGNNKHHHFVYVSNEELRQALVAVMEKHFLGW